MEMYRVEDVNRMMVNELEDYIDRKEKAIKKGDDRLINYYDGATIAIGVLKDVIRHQTEVIDVDESSSYNYDEEIEEVYSYWGNRMPMMAMEEFGELIQAISKMERYINRHKDEEWCYDRGVLESDIIKEIADVLISIKALMLRYSITEDQINYAIDNKLEKRY